MVKLFDRLIRTELNANEVRRRIASLIAPREWGLPFSSKPFIGDPAKPDDTFRKSSPVRTLVPRVRIVLSGEEHESVTVLVGLPAWEAVGLAVVFTMQLALLVVGGVLKQGYAHVSFWVICVVLVLFWSALLWFFVFLSRRSLALVEEVLTKSAVSESGA